MHPYKSIVLCSVGTVGCGATREGKGNGNGNGNGSGKATVNRRKVSSGRSTNCMPHTKWRWVNNWRKKEGRKWGEEGRAKVLGTDNAYSTRAHYTATLNAQ